jgi:uncharacterized RmlC-like cupin family protein
MSSIRTCWATAVNSAKEKAGRERPVFSFLKVPEWTGLRRGNSVASPRKNLIESLLMSHDHTHSHHHHDEERWKHDGVRVIPGNQLDPNVPSTAGMDRKAAINFARVGAQKLWAGTVTIRPDAKTGAHHHGHLESIIYVVKGKARMRWGEKLQFTAEAGPGDFIFVPPYVPHQEINASPDEVLECVLVRSDGEAVAINLDIEPVEKPQTVLWVDPVHRHPDEKK